MKDLKTGLEFLLGGAALLGILGAQVFAQELPKGITEEDLAHNNKLFLELARKALKWEEPAEPVKIAGPIYFVGTKGLGAFLITTSEGDILMNTGMPYFLEMLKPDIWLAQHNEYYDLEGKRQRAQTEGVSAWIDPEGYLALAGRQETCFRGRARSGNGSAGRQVSQTEFAGRCR